MREKYKEIYSKYKSGGMDTRLGELKVKLENKTINSEEYKEMQKIEKVKQNIVKVDNVIKLKEVLDTEAKKIEKQLQTALDLKPAVDFKQLNANTKKLEKELETLYSKKAELKEKIKNASEEEKSKLESKLSEVDKKIDENNAKFAKNEQDKQKFSQEEIQNINKLESKFNDLKNKSARCDIAILNLLKGYSWNTIEIQQDKFQNRTFKCNEKLSEKKGSPLKENIKITSSNVKEVEPKAIESLEVKDVESKITDSSDKKDIEPKSTSTSLVETTEFEKKHPRLAKIKKFFKNIFARKDYEELDDEEIDDEEIDEPNTTSVKSEKTERKTESKEQLIEKQEEVKVQDNSKFDKKIIESKEDEFRKYLKDITEKGYEESARQFENTDKERKLEILKKAKEEAYKRETEKFGEEYAKKSVKEEKLERE